MKDWIIIVGTLLILAIIIDGIRRKRRDRYGKIRMSSNMKRRPKELPSEPEPVASPTNISELPNGGARVIGHRDPSEIVNGLLKRPSIKERKQAAEAARKPVREPEQTRLNLDESVPMLMESVEVPKGEFSERIEPHFSSDSLADELDNDETNYHTHKQNSESEYFEEEYDRENLNQEPFDDDIDEEVLDEEPLEEDFFDEDDVEEDEIDQESEESTQNENQEPDQVYVIHVMAPRDQMLKGAELLDTILQCGMRYGSMDIFHRYADSKGAGAHLFSMANMVKPGTFDLDAMDVFETPGVSFFMMLPISVDSIQTFDLMVDTARTVAGTLGGELKDDQRSVMTKQTLEHCREQIRDYERQRLFLRPK